jgi:hypothetical protein
MKYYTKAQMPAAIKSISGRGQRLQNDIHRIACSIVYGLAQSGDWPSAVAYTNRLMDAMPESLRKEGFKLWAKAFLLMDHGKVDKVDTFLRLTDVSGKGVSHQSLDVVKAVANPFWSYTKEPEAKPFNLTEAIVRVLKQADNHNKKPVEGDVIPAEVLTALRALAA